MEFRVLKRESNWKTHIPFSTSTANWKEIESIFDDYDGMYLRYNCTDWMMLRVFAKIKEKKPQFKIMFELPTYPYDGEIKKKGIRYYRDRVCRNLLYKTVDRIVTYSQDRVIWHIPTINTMNGIDLDTVRVREPQLDRDSFSIIFVANFSRHHGLDRLLSGLSAYYKSGGKVSIITHVVGNISSITVIN